MLETLYVKVGKLHNGCDIITHTRSLHMQSITCEILIFTSLSGQCAEAHVTPTTMMRIRNQIIVIPLFCLVFCYLLIITITLAKSRHVAKLNLSIDEDEGNNDMDFKGIFELDLHPDMSADNFLLAYNRYCTAVFNPPYTNLPPCDCVPTTLGKYM